MSCEQCNVDVCPDCYKTDKWEKYKNTTFKEFKGRFSVEHPKIDGATVIFSIKGFGYGEIRGVSAKQDDE